MSFPPSVADGALINCGRHCSLCHRFCGTKIELHHIVPSGEGGEDSYENCIPLCFDCHAEVKAYNPKHPKGRKYTASELKRHRDLWNEKVKNSHGVVSNPEYIELDRKVFTEIRELLPSHKGSIIYLRLHDYGGSFPDGVHNNLDKFMATCIRPEFEFIDIDLEGLRSKLADSINCFLNAVAFNTYPLEGRPDKNGVPKEWSYGSSEEQSRYFEYINQLNGLSKDISETYDELIRLGRRKLAC